MVKAKRYIFIKPYDGLPSEENFKLVEEELPPLKNGEYLVEAMYQSIDPYMRMYDFAVGDTMIGTFAGKIIESKSKKFPMGKYVHGQFGWRTHAIVHEDYKSPFDWGDPVLTSFEPTSNIPLSLAVGALGMPGNTAYFGMVDVVKPKPGDIIVVSGAAGAIGNHAGQIAKIFGSTVIGIAGSDQKGEWLKSVGFDHVINYKTQDIAKALRKIAPQGVDTYFDNVGGETTSTVIHQMKVYGRIIVCGGISSYGQKNPKISDFYWYFLINRLEMKAFVVADYMDRWNESVLENIKWIQEGKLKIKETVTEGFENMPKTLVGVYAGENTGKAIVKM